MLFESAFFFSGLVKSGEIMALRGIISDLDGVIVDTVPLHFESWRVAFAELGVDFSLQDYMQKMNGIQRLDGARRILAGWDENEIRKAAARKQAIFLESIAGGVETYPTTIALIRDLAAAGYKTAAISSSRNCETILRSIGLYDLFDTVVTGNDIANGKPDPEVFLTAAANLGLEPGECVVFEDAELGVEAARRGAFRCVGIDRAGEPERLRAADIVVGDLAEIDRDRLVRLCEGRRKPPEKH